MNDDWNERERKLREYYHDQSIVIIAVAVILFVVILRLGW